MNYQQSVLPNGIRVLTYPMPHALSASVAFFLGVGSRYEKIELAGASHFIEHMLFKGTNKYPEANLISEAIEGVGGSFNGGTGKELTVYTAKVPSAHLGVAMDVITDMICQPIFNEVEMEKERQVIIEELNMYKDSPQDWVHVLIDEVLWPNMPLGRDEGGTEESVRGLTRDGLLNYMQYHYLPNNLIISVAGSISHEQILDQIDDRLLSWKQRSIPSYFPCPLPRNAERVKVVVKEAEQANICLATQGVSHTDPDYYTLTIISSLLAEGMSSRLFQEIRERQGLAYDVNSYADNYHETGSLVIYAGVDPEKTADTISAICRELKRLSQEPVPAAELERTKEYTLGRMLLRMEDTLSVASWLGGQPIMHGEIIDINTAMANIREVTSEDIMRVAQRLFTNEFLRLAMVGPFHREPRAYEELLSL